jgi:hypothetical protein
MTRVEPPPVEPAAGSTLTTDERDELIRLRHQVAALSAAAPPPRRRFRWRSFTAVVLIVLGCILAPVAGVSVWVHNQVSDTERFVRSVGPLVEDPDVQSALTNRLTATVFQYVDVQGIADDAVTALGNQGLPPELVTRLSSLTPTLTSAVTGFVHDKIGELVASERFEAVWNQAITTASRQMNRILSGDAQSVVIRGDTVYLDLAPFIDLVKQRVSDAGLTAVSLIPEVHPTVALAKADTLVRAQSAYTALDTVATVLPWIVLLLLIVGVYLARNRFRALVGTGLGIALSMVVLAVGLLIARGLLVGAVPARAAPATASGFDIAVTYLRYGLRALLVLGLVLALAGYLAGRSESAVRLRAWTSTPLHSVRGGSPPGPVSRWSRAHVRGLRIGAVALAVLSFVFLTQPSGVAILVIAALLLVVLAVIEFLARPGPETPVEAPPQDAVEVPPAPPVDLPAPR